MVDLRAKVSPDFKDEFLARAESKGLTQNDAVSQALEQWLQPSSQALSLDDTPQEFFSNVNAEKRERLLEGLGEHGVTIEEGNVYLSPQQLLSLASQVSGKTESEILTEALSYMGQKLVTQFLSSASKQGTLGSADPRIIAAIHELRKLISEGEYKPRVKDGKASLGDSVIAGRAMTSVATVRNFLARKGDEISPLLDVSDLIPE
jgi:hypothetical protein